jgi:tRNA threonylcarbamoyladenosine biosynthesis protein TsaB
MQALSAPLLAFDTATPTARVALLSPSGDCLVLREKTAARHSANLLGLCDEVLREGGAQVAELGAIACGAGPGSFTGLRVGLAVAKGLALPTALPLVLVPSLETLACDLMRQSGKQAVVPCIDAGKGQVYARAFRMASGLCTPITDEWVLAPDALCSLLKQDFPDVDLALGGTGIDRYLPVFREAFGAEVVLSGLPGPSAMETGRLALAKLQRGERDDLESAVPRYGRPPDITRPKKSLLAP